MNTPLILFNNILPDEIIRYMQLYITNDFANEAIKHYIHYLYDEQDLYEDFILRTYIYPNCYCHRYKKKECSACYEFEYSNIYKLDQYNICIWDNDQIHKLL